MKELILLTGQIWCGKTIYAKHLQKHQDYAYFNFDDEFHMKTQNVLRKKNPDITVEEEISAFLIKLASFVNKWNKVVVDGWFSWTGEWEDKNFDNRGIIEELQKQLPETKINSIYCVQDLSILGLRYKLGNHSHTVLQVHNYKNSCRKRKKTIIESGVVFSKYLVMNDNWGGDFVEISKENFESDDQWV